MDRRWAASDGRGEPSVARSASCGSGRTPCRRCARAVDRRAWCGSTARRDRRSRARRATASCCQLAREVRLGVEPCALARRARSTSPSHIRRLISIAPRAVVRVEHEAARDGKRPAASAPSHGASSAVVLPEHARRRRDRRGAEADDRVGAALDVALERARHAVLGGGARERRAGPREVIEAEVDVAGRARSVRSRAAAALARS